MTEPDDDPGCDACGKPARHELLGVPFCGGVRCARLIEAENGPRAEPEQGQTTEMEGDHPF